VLCVDDEKIVLEGLKEQLRRQFSDTFSVETVESAEEALEAYAELADEGLEVPIVISDHIMPGMKGADLLAALHLEHPRTLKILLTGQADADAVGRAVNQANLYRYIAKPWSQHDLAITIREALRRYFQDKEIEQKNAELEQLYRELEGKQRTLRRLVAGIVHEVNTPLGAMRSVADTLGKAVERARQALPESEAGLRSGKQLAAAERLMPTLTDGSARIQRLIESLKSFVRLDEAEFKRIDVQQSLDAVLTLLSPEYEGRLRLERNYLDAGAEVECYPAQLSQVFLQLAHNAVNAIDDQGSLWLEVTADEQHVEVKIRDDGRGIASERLSRLFEPGLATKNSGRVGLTMGLALSKRLVEEVGGQLTIDSQLGQGTTACVRLPRQGKRGR
jgi:signal transduction histidine kinase